MITFEKFFFLFKNNNHLFTWTLPQQQPVDQYQRVDDGQRLQLNQYRVQLLDPPMITQHDERQNIADDAKNGDRNCQVDLGQEAHYLNRGIFLVAAFHAELGVVEIGSRAAVRQNRRSDARLVRRVTVRVVDEARSGPVAGEGDRNHPGAAHCRPEVDRARDRRDSAPASRKTRTHARTHMSRCMLKETCRRGTFAN
jgi:hypothetical protein